MSKPLKTSLQSLPTPVAGLALGIAILGACLEYTLPLQSAGQHTGALIAAVLLLALTVKFCCYPAHLAQDLRHAVIGSVVPTYAMGWMVVAKALSTVWFPGAQALWLLAVTVHLCFLGIFIWHRSRDFRLEHTVPAWFVPPVGIHCRRCGLSRRRAGACVVNHRDGKLRRHAAADALPLCVSTRNTRQRQTDHRLSWRPPPAYL